MNTTIIYFKKKARIKDPIHDIFIWILVYHKYIIVIELTFLKELMLMKEANQKTYSLNKSFKFQPNICKRCQDLLMSMNLGGIALSSMKVSGCHGIISRIRKNETVNLMHNADFTKKKFFT